MYWSGSSVERTLGGLDAAETDLLRLAPPPYLCGVMPSLQAHVNRFLPKDDPRRVRMDKVVKKANGGSSLEETDRNAVIAAYHAANSQRRRQIIRLRSFRNVLLVTALGLLLVAIGLGILGSLATPPRPTVLHPGRSGRLPDAFANLHPTP